MACSCKSKKTTRYTVKLPGNLTITKNSEAEALAFAAKHPGAKVIKPAS